MDLGTQPITISASQTSMNLGSNSIAASRTLQQSGTAAAAAAAAAAADAPGNTPWGPAGSVLMCLLPFGFLLTVTLVRQLTIPCSRSLPVAAVMLAVIRLTYLSSSPLAVLGSCLKGLLEGLTPLSVIYGAILLFEAMQHSKCLPWIMHQVKCLSRGNPLAEVFLIGWAFAFMISGVGGFNTPIALGAPMLASLGHDPLVSLLVVVILNTLSSHMGSVGMAIWFGFKSLDLGPQNILLVGLKTAVIVGVISYLLAPVAASFLVPWRDILRSSIFVTLSISSAVIPTVLFAMISPEFPVLIGGVASLIGTTALVYYKIGLTPTITAAAAAAAATAAATSVPGLDDESNSSTAAVDGLELQGCKARVSRCTAATQLFSALCPLRSRKQQHVDDAAEVRIDDQRNSSNSGEHHTDVGLLGRLLPSFVHSSSSSSSTRDLHAAAGPGHHRHRCGAWLSLRSRAAASTVVVGSDAQDCAAGAVTRQNQQQHTNLGQQKEQQEEANLGHQGAVEVSVVPGDGQGDSSEHSAVVPQSRSDAAEDTSNTSSTTASLAGPDLPVLLTRPGGADLVNLSRLQIRSLSQSPVDLPSLATISAPASYWNSSSIHHLTSTYGVDFVVFNPAADLQGCEELWEDAHSLGALPLPASLVGATIHHAALTGVDSAAQRSFGLPVHLVPVPALPTARGHHHHQHQHQHRQQQQQQVRAQHDIESAYQGFDQSPEDQARSTAVRSKVSPRCTVQSLEHRASAAAVVLCRTLPVWLTVLLLLITRLQQLKLQAALQSTEPSFVLQLGTLGTFKLSASLVFQLQQLFMLPNVNWKYEALYVPCFVPFVVASITTIWVYRAEMAEQGLPWFAIFTHAWRKMKGTFPALLGAMVLSELISAGGTGSPAYIIGYYLSAWLGKGYLALAGFLGALGSFVSGSVMSGNMTFGAIQKVAAERTGVPVTSMLAIQVAGSCAGKMMCMSNILSAKVLMNLHQVREGRIVRRTAPLAVLFVLLSQLLGLMFTMGGVWPDSQLPAKHS